jgi:hypothetical protein
MAGPDVIEAELGEPLEQFALDREEQASSENTDIGIVSFALVSAHLMVLYNIWTIF